MIYGGGGRWLKARCWITSEAGEEACNSWLQSLTAKLPKITCHCVMDTHKKEKESSLQQ